MNNPLIEKKPGAVIPKIAETISVTIDEGNTTSNDIDMGGCSIVAIVFPVAFTGTQISFSVSNDGINYHHYVTVGGTTIYVQVTPNGWIGIVPTDFAGVKNIRLISNATEAADRNISLITRNLY